jgi:hypothetical protein
LSSSSADFTRLETDDCAQGIAKAAAVKLFSRATVSTVLIISKSILSLPQFNMTC